MHQHGIVDSTGLQSWSGGRVRFVVVSATKVLRDGTANRWISIRITGLQVLWDGDWLVLRALQHAALHAVLRGVR